MAYMEILLNEDIDNLGHRGDVVRVRAGYGRNYLLPQGLAIHASAGNKKMIEEQKRILAKREGRERQAAQDQGSQLDGVELLFERKVGEHGILYGSVTSMDIHEALKGRGFEVERRRIGLREPIKEVGEYTISMKLHREVNPTVKVVVRKEGSAAAAAAAPAEQPASEAAAAPESAAVEAAPTEE